MRHLILPVVALLLFSSQVFGGNTGKITGRVTDRQTKDALIGANIRVLGTNFGAATDVNGNFMIMNVPPGSYTIKASFIGYSAKEFQNVRVIADLTTSLNIELTPGAVETEPVVIVGSRLIQRDATATASTFQAENFELLPVETFEQALQIQAGVTVDAGGEIHIRGGRSNEVLFLVDGVPVNNTLDNTITTGIVGTNAIQELSVISGAFNAEYGNAQSGVVNLTTKEGSKELSGRFAVQTGDVLSGDETRFLNDKAVNPFNTMILEGLIGGGLPVDGVSYMVSSRYMNDKGYLFGQRLVAFASDARDNLVLGNREYVSMNPDRMLNVQAKLTYTMSPIKFGFSYLLKDRVYRVYANVNRLAPDYQPYYFDRSNIFMINSNYFFTSNTYMTGVISYTRSKYETYEFESMSDPRYKLRARALSYLDNKNNPNGDSLSALLLRDFGLTIDELNHFSIGPGLNRSTEIGNRYNARFDLSSQLNTVHLLKTGVEVSLFDFSRDGISLVQEGARSDNDFNTADEIIQIPNANTRSRNVYAGKPYEYAAYVQDKMEFSEFVLNAGVRIDLYDPNTTSPVHIDNLEATAFQKTSLKSKVSPRISFAHSVTDRSKIFFSYGHFFQLPPYANMFTGREAFTNPLVEIRTGILNTVGGNRAVGNPDLKPQTTVGYEVGYEQELTDDIAVYLKGYYRNITNLLATQVGSLSNGAVYAYYTNRDYGNVRGINLTFKKRLSRSYGYSVDYTYQVAEGNASSPTQTYLNYRSEAQEQKQVVFLDWDQPHTLRWTFDYHESGWQVGIIGKLESGYPYTPSLGSASQGGQQGTEENSGRKPSIFNTDLFLSREFILSAGQGPVVYGVTMKVYNLFDTRNELYVFSNSGRATFSGDPALANYVQFTQRPDYFSKPREVLLGAYIRF